MKNTQVMFITTISVLLLTGAPINANDFDGRVTQFASHLSIPSNILTPTESSTAQIGNASVQRDDYVFDVTNLPARTHFLLPDANKAVSVRQHSETIASGVIYVDDEAITASTKLLRKTVMNTLPIDLLGEMWHVTHSFNARTVITSHTFNQETNQWAPDYSNVNVLGSDFAISLTLTQNHQNFASVNMIVSNLVVAVESTCSP